MSSYRYCFLNETGEIHGGLDVECDNDDHALDGAAQLEHIHGMEVWQWERLVGTIPSAQ
jgi:hypothetical protein